MLLCYDCKLLLEDRGTKFSMKIFDELRRTKKPYVYNYTTANYEGMAFDLIDYEMKKGVEINGWKNYEKNGQKIILSNLIKMYPELLNEYIDKLKQQIINGNYDIDFMEKYIEINIVDRIVYICQKHLYMMPIGVLLLTFFNMELIVFLFKRPTLYTISWNSGPEIIMLLNIIWLFVIVFSIISYLINESITSKKDLTTMLKKIISIFSVLVIIFAIIYTNLLFISSFYNTLRTFNYYIPTKVINYSEQKDFIMSVNNYIVHSKKDMKFFSFGDKDNEEDICQKTSTTLDKESIKNLELLDTNINLNNDSIEVININYLSLLRTFLNMIYFSTVTITTTGFGDIFPSSLLTRIITCTELLIGQFILIIAIGKAFNLINSEKSD